ncbi:MAG: hypothetical protein M3328_16745 [Chloroflexota bacterium]|nr:hypothetical protein [Chloroflexota bacterium]
MDLLELCPDFSRTWEAEAYLYTDEENRIFSFCSVFSAFSHYVATLLTSEDDEPPGLVPVFQYVERCMHDRGDVGTAAATCFLENLMNRTPSEIVPNRFVPLLGPESRYYCRAWDEFCGVRTEGLW